MDAAVRRVLRFGARGGRKCVASARSDLAFRSIANRLGSLEALSHDFRPAHKWAGLSRMLPTYGQHVKPLAFGLYEIADLA